MTQKELLQYLATNRYYLFPDPIGGVRKAVTSLHKTVSDKSHEMTEVLKPFLGKVFHAVGNTGTMYRYRCVNEAIHFSTEEKILKLMNLLNSDCELKYLSCRIENMFWPSVR